MNKMPIVPFFNGTAGFLHVGAVTIPPVETRDVDARLLPGYQAPETVAPAADDPLLAVSALPVAGLSAGLAALADDELTRLEALEQAKAKPRIGALAEIAAERLRRAEAGTPGGLPDDAEAGGAGVESEGGEV